MRWISFYLSRPFIKTCRFRICSVYSYSTPLPEGLELTAQNPLC